MPKLTLSADADMIKRAKQIAEERGTSVSAMFNQFVNSMVQPPPERQQRPGPLTSKAIGLVDLPKDKTDRQLIEDALAARYER